jgi:hypothetical protein
VRARARARERGREGVLFNAISLSIASNHMNIFGIFKLLLFLTISMDSVAMFVFN